MEQFLHYLMEQALGYALFVLLYWDYRRESREREKESRNREIEYQRALKENQELLNKLANCLPSIEKDIEEIKYKLNKE